MPSVDPDRRRRSAASRTTVKGDGDGAPHHLLLLFVTASVRAEAALKLAMDGGGGASAEDDHTPASPGVSDRVASRCRYDCWSSAAIVCSTVALALAPVREAVARGVGDASAMAAEESTAPDLVELSRRSVGRINRGDVTARGLRLGEVRSER